MAPDYDGAMKRAQGAARRAALQAVAPRRSWPIQRKRPVIAFQDREPPGVVAAPGFSPTIRRSRGSRNLNYAASCLCLTSPASAITAARLFGV
jgi:hypothetical protein